MTEAELIRANGAMIFIVWMKYFFGLQMKSIDVNFPLKPLGSNVTIEQDNTSTIQLEMNGWKLNSKEPNTAEIYGS